MFGRPVTARALDALAFLVPLAVYVSSLSPWPDSWDYGEYETVPYILGIAHPPGFPAFVLIGWLFSHVVVVGTVALRLKLLSALFIAGSVFLVRRLAIAFGASEFPAFVAALVFACTSVAWTKAIHTDVHAMALFLSLAVFVSVMAYARSRDGRLLILAAFAYGLGLATHPNVMWSGLALLPGFVAVVRRERRTAVLVVAAAIVPLTSYAYLPIRSAIVEAAHLDPAEAAPIFGEGDVAWDYNRPSSRAGFISEFLGSESSNGAFGGFLAVWRYPAYARDWATAAARELTPAAIVLAFVGVCSLWFAARGLRTAALFVIAGAFAAVPFTFSFGAEADITRYVFTSLGVALAVAARSSSVFPTYPKAATSVVSLALLAIVASLYSRNAYLAGTRNDRNAQPTIDRIVHDVPDGAIVIAGWIELTPLAYGAYVERSMGSRVPIGWLRRDVPRYLDWARERDVFVLSDFVNADEVTSDIPAACRHEIADYGDFARVYRIGREAFRKGRLDRPGAASRTTSGCEGNSARILPNTVRR